MTRAGPRAAVVGGGITGLVAAYRLRTELGPEAQITVVEESDRLGGTLRTVDLAGGPLDVGAEAFIGRRPEVPALMAELGIADQLVHPAGRRPLIYSAGALHPMPAGTLMGIPADAQSIAGLVDAATQQKIADEVETAFAWDPSIDVSVAQLVGSRFGEQVLHRSVDPLLGGVYSGLSDSIGVRAALPTLAAALDSGAPSLSSAVASALPPPSSEPVFGALRGGYGVLVDALIAAAGARIVLGARVESICGERKGWRVDPIGHVDLVVLAVPAPALSAILADTVPDAADAAAGIELASSVVVGMALPGDVELPDNSGVLVATDAGLSVKAFTLSSRKWSHLADRNSVLLRASLGRFGDEGPLGLSDAELVRTAVRDLRTVTGLDVTPTATVVQRWHGGLPQYAPGHLDRVAEIESAVRDVPGVAVAGAWSHGVGVPACVASATRAAAAVCEVAR
ncbi:MAG: protoporphyrinogen oxidase [Rhodococcus sp. (in: high G+C Gram-positive bacteria)]|uniref:protoporphyrinogen oxidase n=1 Tax=Rhodococcus sp. EPR-157 TaxID=1813677 RepID=UPI0007BAF207|nr:protoporphyrinogen oxidase [Rhodococcus sp. EPR-157]KZF05255.1 protoporphyrinogen oxidase [Rhodococcus sp. EPR-157]